MRAEPMGMGQDAYLASKSGDAHQLIPDGRGLNTTHCPPSCPDGRASPRCAE